MRGGNPRDNMRNALLASVLLVAFAVSLVFVIGYSVEKVYDYRNDLAFAYYPYRFLAIPLGLGLLVATAIIVNDVASYLERGGKEGSFFS